MLVRKKGELELGAHSVGAADEHGTLHSARIELEQTAEAAYIRADSCRHGSRDMRFHQFDCLVAGGDVDPRRCVCLGS